MKYDEIVEFGLGNASVYVYALQPCDTEQSLRAMAHSDVDVSCYGSPSRRLEVLGVRAMLWLLFDGRYTIFYCNDKPYLSSAEGAPAPHISISHSKGILCLAVSSTGPIGVDLEVFGKRMQRVRQRFLSPQELAWQADDDLRLTKAHLAWTAKEALYKIIGDEVYDFPNKIEVSSDFSCVTALSKRYALYCLTTEQYALSLIQA